jgi:PiT family inorganic phosphate transporter
VNILLVIFVGIALTFDFLSGFHDSANVVATSIASRAIPPRVALTMAALADFTGPFLFGVAVATTIGNEVISQEAVTIPVALAALSSAIVWNILTWLLGLPSSSSHALIGGFVGSAIAGFGLHVVRLEVIVKMGILTLGLVAFGVLPSFHVPIWVILASASAISLGTFLGGWRLIRTMGTGFYRVRPLHAFSSQVASFGVIIGAAL